MTDKSDIPDPGKIEKEIGEFLNKKFGGRVQLIPQYGDPEAVIRGKKEGMDAKKSGKIPDFNLLPKEMTDYLDQFIIKQDNAKAVLATKICTHFNRLAKLRQNPQSSEASLGRIKNNILLIGPTGVGKTYLIKLIANKIGVPFVKGDATKFSETGYVGGDVEDLVRDLAREADNDISLAEYGIIYIDEIDKIASSKNFSGADISRTGVQRALLKPMEETDVELQPPHDPVSMMEALAEFQKTGTREKKLINTKNILFIVSGAFSQMEEIISKRLKKDVIGFNANPEIKKSDNYLMHKIMSEDLIKYGFESEFVGRLPVRAVLDPLNENDLYEILKNPNNPVILGKKSDFLAYGIRICFTDDALKLIAKNASKEQTGARGLVNSIENALMKFETNLPSSAVKKFAFTSEIIENPEKTLFNLDKSDSIANFYKLFNEASLKEEEKITEYITKNRENLEASIGFMLSDYMIKTSAKHYLMNIETIKDALLSIKEAFYEVKSIEDETFTDKNLYVELSEEAADFLVNEYIFNHHNYLDIKKSFLENFSLGLMLASEKTNKKRFVVTKEGLTDPEGYISQILKIDNHN
ncbi:MAG: AAA family ATPase [Desulforegulaceae bacterium]|nr:AAA family ATPase [Desulforegulaceae bacterium]